MDRGAWRATAHGIAKSQTRLNTSCNIKQAGMCASGDPGWLGHRMLEGQVRDEAGEGPSVQVMKDMLRVKDVLGFIDFILEAVPFKPNQGCYVYRYTSQRKSPKSHSTPSGHINFI